MLTLDYKQVTWDVPSPSKKSIVADSSQTRTEMLYQVRSKAKCKPELAFE